MNKATLEKVFEYASMPVHGTLSRKLRKGVKVQINEDRLYAEAVLFLGDEFLRISESQESEAINTYYSWDKIVSVRTISRQDG
ncbi:MAG: hypothetical protein EHM86_09945 [Desulfobulbaceae bacterium]|jgi:hypothetical protein|nr:MAG: hypothetical protein EHM86_09945 [Desulfobulbaceae bacterium]